MRAKIWFGVLAAAVSFQALKGPEYVSPLRYFFRNIDGDAVRARVGADKMPFAPALVRRDLKRNVSANRGGSRLPGARRARQARFHEADLLLPGRGRRFDRVPIHLRLRLLLLSDPDSDPFSA